MHAEPRGLVHTDHESTTICLTPYYVTIYISSYISSIFHEVNVSHVIADHYWIINIPKFPPELEKDFFLWHG